MKLLKFLFSKSFYKNLFVAAVLFVISVFAISIWLSGETHHGEYVKVPTLTGKSLKSSLVLLKDLNLRLEVQDSANYTPKYPKLSIVEQYPEPGTKVKKNRKIYLTINPTGYRKVSVPSVVRNTFRQAKSAIEAIGFQVGKIKYVDDLGKDEVVNIMYKGDTLKTGVRLELKSKIDFILGNGTKKVNKSEDDVISNKDKDLVKDIMNQLGGR